MAKTVFYYFPGKPMAQPAHFLLAYGGEDFEGVCFNIDNWFAAKSSMPFGQLPVLQVDGKKYAQSMSIARYLGHKHGLAGDNLLEALEIDQIVDYLNDLRIEAAQVHYEPNEATKLRKHQENMKNKYPLMLNKLDEIIKKNNGHLVLGKLTWGDFVFTGIFDYLKVMLEMPDLEQKYPSFKQVLSAVRSIPKVKAFIDNAQKSE